MFKEKISVEFKRSGGRHYEKLCLMFPGQGRILPESYLSYFDIPTVREVFQEADELASMRDLPPISGLIFKDRAGAGSPKDEISAPRVLMLNLFQLTISTALFRYLLQSGRKPDYLTAHSFGEYGALHCASVYDFETAFEIVRLREDCSPAPGDLGTLVAVSASREDLDRLKLPEYHLANINSPKQIVLAVPSKGLKGFLHALRKERIAAKELQSVGRPYHSPLMRESTEAFREKLAALKIQPKALTHAFVSSVGGGLYEKGFLFSEEDLKTHLARQFVVPVDFDAQARRLRDLKNFGFLELGSVPVLRDFIKQIFGDASDFHATFFGDYLNRKQEQTGGSVQKFEIKDSRLMSSVLGFVSKITGYSVHEISVNHRFEDDLRIDSIKKAEILFRSLEENKLESEAGLELSKLRHVGDLVAYIENRKSRAPAAAKEEEARFEIAEETWTPDLRPGRTSCPEDAFERIDVAKLKEVSAFGKPNVVVDLSSGEFEDPLEVSEHLYRLIVPATGAKPPAQILIFSREETSLSSAIYSFLLSLRKENIAFRVKKVISREGFSSESAASELGDPLCFESRIAAPERFVKTLAPLRSASTASGGPLESPQILSIGGSTGLLKHYLSQSRFLGEAKLVLVGRSPETSEKVASALTSLREKIRSVHYRQCDVTDRESVRGLLSDLQKTSFKPDFVFDASGSEVSRLYGEKSAEEKKNEFRSKTLGIRHLEDVFRLFGLPRSRYIQFNSITSRYGNAGQTIYALGDGASLVQAVSHVVWPAVHRLGMTENLGILQKLLSLGVDLLPQEKVVDFLDQIVETLASATEPRSFEIVSLKDRLILQLQMLDEDWLKKTLGEVEIRPSLRLRKRLDPDGLPFLKDHIISGRCIVPGCYGFASMYMLAKIYFNRRPSVSDFHLKSLIPLDSGPVDTFVSVRPETLRSLSLSVSSRVENYMADFDGEGVTEEQRVPERLRVVYDMKMGDFYSTKYVYHGPTFQVLKRVQISEDGRCLSEFVSPGVSPISESDDFDHIAKLVESVFQSAGFLATWHDFVSLVPTYIGSVRHHSGERTERLSLVTSPLRRKTEPERWVTDVDVYNSHGEIYMTFREVTGMKIKKYSSFPVDHEEITGSESRWIVTSSL